MPLKRAEILVNLGILQVLPIDKANIFVFEVLQVEIKVLRMGFRLPDQHLAFIGPQCKIFT